MLKLGTLIVFTEGDLTEKLKRKHLEDFTVDDFDSAVIWTADMVVFMDRNEAIILKDRYGITSPGGSKIKKMSFAKKCMNAIKLHR